MIRRIGGILQSRILSGNIRQLLLRVNVVVKVTTKDSYLVTTGTEFALHVPHEIGQIIKPPFQGFYPLNVHGAVRLEESDVCLQGLNQVQLSPPSLLQLMNSQQDFRVVILEALDHRFVTF